MKQAFRIPLVLFLFLVVLVTCYHTSFPHLSTASLDTGHASSSPSSSALPKLHFLLPATHATPEFCKTLLTTLVHGYEPTVINWGRKEKGGQARQIKIRGVHDYITNNITNAATSEDLVFMIDAFDVWLQQPPSVLVSKFLSLGPPKILIGADKRCWPPSPNPRECHDIPHSTLPSHIFGLDTDTGAELPHDHTYYLNRPRYPNSGTILSPARLLLPLYNSLLRQSETRDKNLGDQQMFLTTYYSDFNNLDPLSETRLSPGVSSLQPDFESELFQTATYSEHDLVFKRSLTYLPHPNSAASALAPERLVSNKISGTTPAVLHFNGGEKKLLKTWWGEMWWVTGGQGSKGEREEVRRWVKEVVRKGGVTVAKTGGWVGWEEMGCEGREEEGEVWGVMKD